MGRIGRGPLATLVVALGIVSAAGLVPAAAQTSVASRASAASGKAVRLAVAPSLKRDCSVGPLPEIRITSAPKNGSLITRSGKLRTPGGYRCPNRETEVQAIFYQSNPRYTGADEAVFEIKTSDGVVEKRTVQITVGGAAPAKESTDL